MTFEDWFQANHERWIWRLADTDSDVARERRKAVRRAVMDAWHEGRREGVRYEHNMMKRELKALASPVGAVRTCPDCHVAIGSAVGNKCGNPCLSGRGRRINTLAQVWTDGFVFRAAEWVIPNG